MVPTWKGIVLHHSADPDDPWVDVEDFEAWHRERGWRDVGYHWAVELLSFPERTPRYHALMGRPMTMIGSHCPGLNATHLGVVLAGNFELAPPPAEQIHVAAELCSGLCRLGDFSPLEITVHGAHRETACPGHFFPLDEIVQLTYYLLERP